MKPTSVIAALSLFFIPVLSAAGESVPAATLADTAGVHVVRPGDTLWDISGAYLGNPFSWPELWDRNGFIRNPHLIFPGQTITIIRKPVLPPAPPVPAPVSEDTTAAAPAPETAPPDTANVIRMLPEPRPVFTVKNYMRTGFITKRSEVSRSRVVRLEDGVIGAVHHDMVIAETGSDARQGALLAVIAVGDRVKHPDTGHDYGVVVRIKGVMEIMSVNDGQARCVVTEMFDPIMAGDLVMPYAPDGGPLFDAWVRPDALLTGVVLAVNEPMISIHTDDVLYIDKGRRDGVRPGDVFMVYRRVKPGERDARTPLGVVEAVNVMSGESAVIVTSLKAETMAIGNRVELFARCRIVGE